MEASFEFDDETNETIPKKLKVPGASLKDLIKEIEQMINNNDPVLDVVQDKFLLLQSLQELDTVVGMKRLKDTVSLQVKDLITKKRLQNGTCTKKMMSVILFGPPGTGKSSVGRIYAKILYALGYLNDQRKTEIRNLAKNNQEKIGVVIVLFFLLGYLFSFISGHINKYLVYFIITVMVFMFIYIAAKLFSSGNAKPGAFEPATLIQQVPRAASNNKDIFKVVSKEDLVAGYLGQTSIKTSKVLEENRGKVLFIEEAYSICRDSRDAFGKECLDTITNFLTENPEYVIMFAGYEPEMKKSILRIQPGIARRCMYIMRADPYNGKELYEIFRRQLAKDNFQDKYDSDIAAFFEENQHGFVNYGGDTERLLYYSQLHFSEDNYRNAAAKKRITINHIKKGFKDLMSNNDNAKLEVEKEGLEDLIAKVYNKNN